MSDSPEARAIAEQVYESLWSTHESLAPRKQSIRDKWIDILTAALAAARAQGHREGLEEAATIAVECLDTYVASAIRATAAIRAGKHPTRETRCG